MKELIKLEGEIDLTKPDNEVRIKSNDGIWEDFGYWMEATGFMAYQAMKYKEWSEYQMIDYMKDYFVKCLRDYRLPPIIPPKS